MLDNCRFENMLDDATNVHGIYVALEHKTDNHTVGALRVHYQQYGFDFASPGDTIQFADRQTFSSVGRFTLKSIREVNQEYFEMTFNESLENIDIEGLAAENISCRTDVHITGCTVRQNRARSILLSSRGTVLVENNTFSSMMAGVLISGDMNYWFESGPVEQVVIRNNTFINCCTGGQDQAAIMVNPNIRQQSDTTVSFHRNITIEGNVFKTFDKAILRAFSVNGLIFRNNKIELNNDFPPLHPGNPVVEIVRCQKVELTGNKYIAPHSADVVVDPSSAGDLLMKGNTNFPDKPAVDEQKVEESL